MHQMTSIVKQNQFGYGISLTVDHNQRDYIEVAQEKIFFLIVSQNNFGNEIPFMEQKMRFGLIWAGWQKNWWRLKAASEGTFFMFSVAKEYFL